MQETKSGLQTPKRIVTSATLPSIRFRGHSLIALVLVPETPFDEWLSHLDGLSRRAPGFFHGRPVILDTSNLGGDKPGLLALLSDLSGRGIRVMGLEAADAALLGPDVPPLLSGGHAAGQLSIAAEKLAEERAPRPEASEPLEPPEIPDVPKPASLLIDRPVRSGQSICFPEGDVTVLGSVSSGAEVIAGGSIHVYGALRGRAVAGSAGDSKARIYCRKLEAELLMIDGAFRTDDDLGADLRGRPVQAWLADGSISLATLD